MERLLIWMVFCIAGVFCQYTDPHCEGKQVIVHLFEWKWTDIALECERFLSKKGFCGVQVSPVNEHVMVTSPHRPWWERYQPVSYKLTSRSGTKAEFADMVSRCKAVGVRVYVDVLLNHMARLGKNETGIAGSYFNSDNLDFQGVPYTEEHFNPYCYLNSDNDKHIIKDCYLLNLTDLNQSNEYVRNTLAAFLNNLIDLGVAGFRVDASKHMWVDDITAIQNKVKDMPEGGRPFFYHEVVDQQGTGPVTSQQYTPLGYVTEFRYSQKLTKGIQDFGRLGGVVDYSLGMTDSEHAFVFVDNHDNERGHGAARDIITFDTPREYKMAVAFILANDYGFARVMSSYYFGQDTDRGPPQNPDDTTKDVPVSADGLSCGTEWVCEHKWRSVANMVAFRNAVVGTSKENFYIHNNQIAFSRGSVGFFAMSRDGTMDITLQTGLPAGQYCDLITECAKVITVNENSEAKIVIDNPDEPVIAFIVDGPTATPGIAPSSVKTTSSTAARETVTVAPSTKTLPITTVATSYTNVNNVTAFKTDTTSSQSSTTRTRSNSTTTTATTNLSNSTTTTATTTGSNSTTTTSATKATSQSSTTTSTTATPSSTIRSTSTTATTTTTTTLRPATTSDTTIPMTRTIILVEKETRDGEDVFIRGGLDHDSHPGLNCHDYNMNCAIPIQARTIGIGEHYRKYHDWSVNDDFLDWYGAEPEQGKLDGYTAEGTPAVWTTNDKTHDGYSKYNTYGEHYWLVDMDMNCSRTDNDWFEIKAVVNSNWEQDFDEVTQCTGDGADSIPAITKNHWARCGMFNVYHFNNSSCQINQIPPN